jgi:hypothetical protein
MGRAHKASTHTILLTVTKENETVKTITIHETTRITEVLIIYKAT